LGIHDNISANWSTSCVGRICGSVVEASRLAAVTLQLAPRPRGPTPRSCARYRRRHVDVEYAVGTIQGEAEAGTALGVVDDVVGRACRARDARGRSGTGRCCACKVVKPFERQRVSRPERPRQLTCRPKAGGAASSPRSAPSDALPSSEREQTRTNWSKCQAMIAPASTSMGCFAQSSRCSSLGCRGG
jgi:hypothetical protein